MVAVLAPVAPVDAAIVVAITPVMVLAPVAPVDAAIMVAIAPATVPALFPAMVTLVPTIMVLLAMMVMSAVTPVVRIGLGGEAQSDDGGDEGGDEVTGHGSPRFLQTWKAALLSPTFVVGFNVATDLVRPGS